MIPRLSRVTPFAAESLVCEALQLGDGQAGEPDPPREVCAPGGPPAYAGWSVEFP